MCFVSNLSSAGSLVFGQLEAAGCSKTKRPGKASEIMDGVMTLAMNHLPLPHEVHNETCLTMKLSSFSKSSFIGLGGIQFIQWSWQLGFP